MPYIFRDEFIRVPKMVHVNQKDIIPSIDGTSDRGQEWRYDSKGHQRGHGYGRDGSNHAPHRPAYRDQRHGHDRDHSRHYSARGSEHASHTGRDLGHDQRPSHGPPRKDHHAPRQPEGRYGGHPPNRDHCQYCLTPQTPGQFRQCRCNTAAPPPHQQQGRHPPPPPNAQHRRHSPPPVYPHSRRAHIPMPIPMPLSQPRVRFNDPPPPPRR